jgi:xanthine/uracil permease
VALFVLLIVGIIVAQTWLDWRDTQKDLVIPDWAKGTALAGLIGVSLAAASSYASVWLEDASHTASGVSSRQFWPQLAFLVCAMTVVVVATRKKRLRLMLLLTGVVIGAFWLGLTLSS